MRSSYFSELFFLFLACLKLRVNSATFSLSSCFSISCFFLLTILSSSLLIFSSYDFIMSLLDSFSLSLFFVDLAIYDFSIPISNAFYSTGICLYLLLIRSLIFFYMFFFSLFSKSELFSVNSEIISK